MCLVANVPGTAGLSSVLMLMSAFLYKTANVSNYMIIPSIARLLLPLPIVTRKSYNKNFIAIPRVWQYGEMFYSRPWYHPSLRLGRYGKSQTEIIYIYTLFYENVPKVAETAIEMHKKIDGIFKTYSLLICFPINTYMYLCLMFPFFLGS